MDAAEESDAVVRRVLHITGFVQGVWFRDSTRREAERRHVAGWVRNLPDGSVEAVLEGPPIAVDELAAWCAIGPPHARVDAVETIEEVPVGLSGFLVR